MDQNQKNALATTKKKKQKKKKKTLNGNALRNIFNKYFRLKSGLLLTLLLLILL